MDGWMDDWMDRSANRLLVVHTRVVTECHFGTANAEAVLVCGAGGDDSIPNICSRSERPPLCGATHEQVLWDHQWD